MPEITPLILGSVAVGALVSSIITLIGQAIERRARKRELILDVDRACGTAYQLFKDAAQATGGEIDIQPYIFYTRWHHREFKKLLETANYLRHSKPNTKLKWVMCPSTPPRRINETSIAPHKLPILLRRHRSTEKNPGHPLR